MARCTTCDTHILLGGVRDGERRFCDDDCHVQGRALDAAAGVPGEAVMARAKDTHEGPCPVCNVKRGPVDVRTSYRALSFIVMTQWATRARVSCRLCHYKAVFGNSVLTFLFGWWGFPWGLLATPIQLSRNVLALLPSGGSTGPSERLLGRTRLQIGAELLSAREE